MAISIYGSKGWPVLEGLNWNYKLVRETWKPSCSGFFYAERSGGFDFHKISESLRIRTILNYFAVVPVWERLQNTPQLPTTSFACVETLCGTRHNTHNRHLLLNEMQTSCGVFCNLARSGEKQQQQQQQRDNRPRCRRGRVDF